MRRSLLAWWRTKKARRVLGRGEKWCVLDGTGPGTGDPGGRRGGLCALEAVESGGTSTMRARHMAGRPPARQRCPQFPQVPVYACSGGGQSGPNGLFTGAVIHANAMAEGGTGVDEANVAERAHGEAERLTAGGGNCILRHPSCAAGWVVTAGN